ncbi:MAG: hypothetical protein ACOY3Y_19610 [Acidobacteriota bacterium]
MNARGTSAIAVLLGVIAATTAARSAPGYGGKILSPSGGQLVTAGEVVVVCWSALAPDVDEMELMLSLDGGRAYALRLTPQLDPERLSFHWLVPNLPTEHARLRVRYGRHGEENDAEAGGVFGIKGASIPAAVVRYHSGEWWTGAHAPHVAGALEPHENRVHRPGSGLFLADPTDIGAPEGRPRTPCPERSARETVESEPAPEQPCRHHSSRPLDLPRRE